MATQNQVPLAGAPTTPVGAVPPIMVPELPPEPPSPAALASLAKQVEETPVQVYGVSTLNIQMHQQGQPLQGQSSEDDPWKTVAPAPKPEAAPALPPPPKNPMIESIRLFFGYLFLLTAGFLAITQAIIFPFAASTEVGWMALSMLWILTLGSIFAAVLGGRSKGQVERLGHNIATVGALTLSLGFLVMMAAFALTHNDAISGFEYFVLFTYMISFGLYGFWSTGAVL